MVALEQEYGTPYHLTVDEYFAWQRTQEVRHEYASGVVYAMAGATYAHNHVAVEMTSILRPAARSEGCRVTQSDMALYVEQASVVYYPDVMVACEPLADDLVERAPCLVVEVLSPATQGRDRTLKLGHYSSLPSLKVYLMVSSDPADQFVIEHRNAGSIWRHKVYGPDDVIALECPEVSFTVRDLYAGLTPRA